MKKQSRLEMSVKSAVKSTLNRFKDLSPTDRFVLLEELGEWVFCEYEEIDFEWLNYQQCGGSSNE